jgi:hypothetical protein
MEKTTLYLPTELQRALKDAARRSGRPQADLVRDALTEYLAKQPQPSPRSIGLGNDPALDARRLEEILDREWGGRAHP